MASQHGQWRPKLLLLAGSLLIAFTAGEVFLRLIGIDPPVFQQFDPVTGRSLVPGSRGWFTTEGRAFVQINSDGMRDREHSIAKPENCVRIAILGDSFAEALQVPLEDSFPLVIERTLNDQQADNSPRYEVLNFGVSGYGTGSELLTLRNKVWKYQPDIVVLAVFTGNDIRNNSRALSSRFDVARPFFEISDTGTVITDESFRESHEWQRRHQAEKVGIVGITSRSVIVRLLRRALSRSNSAPGRTPPDRPWEEPGIDLEVFREPQDDNWHRAWTTTERLISEFRNDVAQHGARLIVFTLSTGIQVHPDPAVRARFKTAMGIEHEFYPDRRIASYCQSERISVFGLAEPLQLLANDRNTYFHGFNNTQLGTGHWNQAGHEAAGLLMAKQLRKMLTD